MVTRLRGRGHHPERIVWHWGNSVASSMTPNPVFDQRLACTLGRRWTDSSLAWPRATRRRTDLLPDFFARACSVAGRGATVPPRSLPRPKRLRIPPRLPEPAFDDGVGAATCSSAGQTESCFATFPATFHRIFDRGDRGGGRTAIDSFFHSDRLCLGSRPTYHLRCFGNGSITLRRVVRHGPSRPNTRHRTRSRRCTAEFGAYAPISQIHRPLLAKPLAGTQHHA